MTLIPRCNNPNNLLGPAPNENNLGLLKLFVGTRHERSRSLTIELRQLNFSRILKASTRNVGLIVIGREENLAIYI